MKNIQLEQNYSRAVKGPQFIMVAAMLAEPTAIYLVAPVLLLCPFVYTYFFIGSTYQKKMQFLLF